MKNPYETLGIGQSSSQEEIKKAFKKLALQYHPDKAENDEQRIQFEEKFKEINEAYQQAINPHHQGGPDDSIFDNISNFINFNFDHSNFARDFFGINVPRDNEYSFNITLDKKAFVEGSTHIFNIIEYNRCGECNGDPYIDKYECPACKGKCFLINRIGSMILKRPCNHCSGRGFLFKDKCKHCVDGQKQTEKMYSVKVFPAEEIK